MLPTTRSSTICSAAGFARSIVIAARTRPDFDGRAQRTRSAGFPHGMPTTEAETITADLLAFLQS